VLDVETLSSYDVVRLGQSLNIASLPQQLQNIQAYCTDNVIVTTLSELVKMGKVECIQKIGSSWSKNDWNPYYRRILQRVTPQNDVHTSTKKRSSKFSHLMKLSKPWKRAKM
jgi:hypothetical protein